MMHVIIDASPKFKGTSDNSLYGDVVAEFDYETGRLLDKLDELGLSENTLVIYTTDNGPWSQEAFRNRKKGHPQGSIFWGDSNPWRGAKGSCYEGRYASALYRAVARQGPGGSRVGRGLRDDRFPADVCPAGRLRGCRRIA